MCLLSVDIIKLVDLDFFDSTTRNRYEPDIYATFKVTYEIIKK